MMNEPPPRGGGSSCRLRKLTLALAAEMLVVSALEEDPALVNSSPEEDGWFFKMTVSDKSELEGLMDDKAYKSFCDGL